MSDLRTARPGHVGRLDIDFELEDIAPGGRIGLIILATDYNAEADIRRMLPAGTELLTNRVMNVNPLTNENLRAMGADITRAAAGILPGRGVDVIAFGCTSGVAAIGEAEVERRIRAAQPGVLCTNPVAAARTALDALGARNISVLTPYIESVNAELARRFGELGLAVLNIGGFDMEDDTEMSEIPRAAIVEGALQVAHPDADALFISCTALRAASVIDELERQLNIPVVTSNQVLAWHCLELLNNRSRVSGYGALFEKRLASTPGICA
ncbi:MAG: maleate cis-trans isomerase family protein [Rhodospirillales bacterium]